MPVPPAASQLLYEVQTCEKDASFEPVGEADGLGVHRVVQFDEESSKWLPKVMDVVLESNENRVQAVGQIDGHTHVTFVGDTRADFIQPFRIAEVKVILEDDDLFSKNVEAPKKRAAKKVAKKSS